MSLFTDVFTNIFWEGEVESMSPDAEGDLYKISDLQQDHNYWQGKLVDTVLALSVDPSDEFQIISGGIVSDGGSGTVNITACVAITVDNDGNKRIVQIPALTGVTIPTGWNDGRQIWVIAKYDFKLSSATRVHKTMSTSYHYQIQDTYYGDASGFESTSTNDLFTDSDPDGTAVILGSFTMTGNTFADQEERSISFSVCPFPIGATYKQLPAANNNDPDVAFPSAQSPGTLFGGAWTLIYSTEGIVFQTEGYDGAGRANGLMLDQMQNHVHQILQQMWSESGSENDHIADGGNSAGAILSIYTKAPSAAEPGDNPRTGTRTAHRNRLMRVYRRDA